MPGLSVWNTRGKSRCSWTELIISSRELVNYRGRWTLLTPSVSGRDGRREAADPPHGTGGRGSGAGLREPLRRHSGAACLRNAGGREAGGMLPAGVVEVVILLVFFFLLNQKKGFL